MSLECLAILGHRNEPLYICSMANNKTSSGHQPDAFGFFDASPKDNNLVMTTNVSVRHEFMLHSALDLLGEILGPTRPTNLKRFQQGSNWLGLLCSIEEYDLYGYSTPTMMKIVALIGRENILPLKKRREAEIKTLFSDVHGAFVKYNMNPFTNLKTKIEPPCGIFEQGVDAAIRKYKATAAPIDRSEWREGLEL